MVSTSFKVRRARTSYSTSEQEARIVWVGDRHTTVRSLLRPISRFDLVVLCRAVVERSDGLQPRS